jgi:hypothetical protein
MYACSFYLPHIPTTIMPNSSIQKPHHTLCTTIHHNYSSLKTILQEDTSITPTQKEHKSKEERTCDSNPFHPSVRLRKHTLEGEIRQQKKNCERQSPRVDGGDAVAHGIMHTRRK